MIFFFTVGKKIAVHKWLLVNYNVAFFHWFDSKLLTLIVILYKSRKGDQSQVKINWLQQKN